MLLVMTGLSFAGGSTRGRRGGRPLPHFVDTWVLIFTVVYLIPEEPGSTPADLATHRAEHEAHHGLTDASSSIFCVVLALEVSTEWWDEWFGESSRKIAVPLLIFLMVVKFFLVALYFMHLKFDQPMLRRIFWFGAIVAMAVYGGTLTSMNFWEDSGTTRFNDPPPALDRPAEGGSDAAVEPGAGSGQTTADGGS